jgi:ribonuclease PH
MNVVMTGAGEFVEIQATSERMTFNDERLVSMLALARQGLLALFEIQRAVFVAR